MNLTGPPKATLALCCVRASSAARMCLPGRSLRCAHGFRRHSVQPQPPGPTVRQAGRPLRNNLPRWCRLQAKVSMGQNITETSNSPPRKPAKGALTGSPQDLPRPLRPAPPDSSARHQAVQLIQFEKLFLVKATAYAEHLVGQHFRMSEETRSPVPRPWCCSGKRKGLLLTNALRIPGDSPRRVTRSTRAFEQSSRAQLRSMYCSKAGGCLEIHKQVHIGLVRCVAVEHRAKHVPAESRPPWQR